MDVNRLSGLIENAHIESRKISVLISFTPRDKISIVKSILLEMSTEIQEIH